MTTDHTPPADRAAQRDRIAEAALRAVEAALGDTLLPAAREEALAGIAAVLPPPVSRADVLREALAAAEAVNGRFPYGASGERIIAELQRLTDEAQPGTEAAS